MISMKKEKLANETLRIHTTTNDPYVMKKTQGPEVTPGALARMSFDEKYEGFLVDLIKDLAATVKFKYKFVMIEGAGYGKIGDDGRWTGLIADLRNQQADMA